MKNILIALITIALAMGSVTGAVLAVNHDGYADPEPGSIAQVAGSSGNQPAVRSDDNIGLDNSSGGHNNYAGDSGTPGPGEVPPSLPEPLLVFQGLEYTLEPGSAEITEGDLEFVGTATEADVSRPGEQLGVYRAKTGGTAQVYTFTPGTTWQNPEDGQRFTTRAEWLRWTAS